MAKRLKVTYFNGEEKTFKSIQDIDNNLLDHNGKKVTRKIIKTEIIDE